VWLVTWTSIGHPLAPCLGHLLSPAELPGGDLTRLYKETMGGGGAKASRPERPERTDTGGLCPPPTYLT
jgi:hypothetical protein